MQKTANYKRIVRKDLKLDVLDQKDKYGQKVYSDDEESSEESEPEEDNVNKVNDKEKIKNTFGLLGSCDLGKIKKI